MPTNQATGNGHFDSRCPAAGRDQPARGRSIPQDAASQTSSSSMQVMVKSRARVPISRLHELFELTEDGRLINRCWRSSRSLKGAEAGSYSMTTGYRETVIAGVHFLTHRIVFAMANGRWPHNQVDHIDGNKINNHPSNLRDVVPRVNSQNRRGAQSTNRLGVLGVSLVEAGRFQASITDKGVYFNLGRFATEAEAVEIYLAAKKVLHPNAYCVRDTQIECFSTCEVVHSFRRFLRQLQSHLEASAYSKAVREER